MTKQLNRVRIDQYPRDKKVLKTVFPMISEQVYFEKHLLPEFLWLAYLREYFGEIGSHNKMSEFSEVFDNYYTPENNSFFNGTVSTFQLIDESKQELFLKENEGLVEELIIKPFGNVIALYPECPMSWLNKSVGPIDPKGTIDDLEIIVRKLQDSKSDYTGNIRAMPFNQILKHGKVHFKSDMKESIESIKEYPNGDRYRAQTMARSIFNVLEGQKEVDHNWAKYFWDYNFKLIKCNER